MSTRYIEGIIKVVTPLHVASMGSDGGDKNVIYTTKMPVFTENGRAYLPYFPGNDLRGRMRRRAANKVMERVQPVPLKIYSALSCGAGSTSPEKGSKSISMLIKSRDDLYLGLFGGGPRLHKSGMRVRSLYPITNVTIDAGMVPDTDIFRGAMTGIYNDKSGESALPHMLHHYTTTRLDDALDGQDMKAPIRVEDYEAALAEYIERVTRADAKRKKEKEEGKNKSDREKKLGLRNIVSVEALNAGTPLYLRIDFDDYLTDAQINLAVQCLSEVLSEPVGGWVRSGFGQLKIDKLHLVDGDNRIDVMYADSDGNRSVRSDLPGSGECEEALGDYTLDKLIELLMPSDQEEDEGDE